MEATRQPSVTGRPNDSIPGQHVWLDGTNQYRAPLPAASESAEHWPSSMASPPERPKRPRQEHAAAVLGASGGSERAQEMMQTCPLFGLCCAILNSTVARRKEAEVCHARTGAPVKAGMMALRPAEVPGGRQAVATLVVAAAAMLADVD